ncbi:MAG: hypothetical protein AB3N21_01260 [Ruegeria sp.]|uniref:hypothetical protein n=1 Tax=Ruegeria sp. TaxID=1879320 RepID=UPI00349EEDC4
MTFEEALAVQSLWVRIWVTWLVIGAFILPLGLLIWRNTRIAGLVTVAASVVAGMGVQWIYDQLGYVRLMGLPHIIIWVPVVLYLYRLQGNRELSPWAVRLIWVIMATLLVSLAFDIVDVGRYALGEREPF